MGIIIRRATTADLAEAELVSRRAFALLREVYRPSVDHQAGELEHPVALDQVVAEVDGRVVGTVKLRADEDYLFVIGLAVDPAYQRQGIARVVLDWLFDLARDSGRGLALATIRETGNVHVFQRARLQRSKGRGGHMVRE